LGRTGSVSVNPKITFFKPGFSALPRLSSFANAFPNMFNSVGTAAGRELLGVKHETDVKLETDDITQKMAIIFRAERDSILIRRLLSAGCKEHYGN
jgi:hypothetical protein